MSAAALCMPQFFAWLQFFDDLPLVTVLAAHAVAETPPSELQCAALTRLHRETVHKKKCELIARGVLSPEPGRSGRGWQGLPCRIDWQRLDSIVGKPTIEPGQLPENRQLSAGKPTIESPENRQLNAGKPTIEPGQLPENRQLNPPHLEERAPAPASLGLASLAFRKLAVAEALRERITRSGLKTVGPDVEELSDVTVRNVCNVLQQIAPTEVEEVLEFVEQKCRDWKKHPAKAKSWGILVTAVAAEVERIKRREQRMPPASSPDAHTRQESGEFDEPAFRQKLKAMMAAAGKGMR